MKNGNKLQDISEIGKIIAKMASEYSFIKMQTNTKVCGRVIDATDKVHTGETKQVNCAENILEIGLKIRNMEEVHSSIKMETGTTGTGLMAAHKEKAE